MKKKGIVVFFVFLFIALGYYFTGSSFDVGSLLEGPTGGAISSAVKDQGNIEVYFCPEENCEGVFLAEIDSAKKTLNCALFDIGLASIQQKLLEKNDDQSVTVQVVTDNDYVKKFNHPFVKPDKWGLMHNKFCVIDGTKLVTGSMNPTENGVNKNNNNLLVIKSKLLADNYDKEFWEMWAGTFKKGKQVVNPIVALDNGVSVKNYFCPEDDCARRIKIELEKAENSINFMTFSFTHTAIANSILLKHKEGVKIKGVMEARQISKYSKYDVLSYQVSDIFRDKNKNNMHHKVFIIDEKVVITGSMNPTQGGDKRNDENLLIIYDEDIAEEYTKEFERIYLASRGIYNYD